jgi:hypothetical protein
VVAHAARALTTPVATTAIHDTTRFMLDPPRADVSTPIRPAEAVSQWTPVSAWARRTAFEARLPNPPFLRVHRSHIVNLDHVARMGLLDGQVEVHMKSGATVPVSRVRSQELRRLSR